VKSTIITIIGAVMSIVLPGLVDGFASLDNQAYANAYLYTAEMMERLEALAERGVKFLLLQYELTPDQVRCAAQRAHELGMVTAGELGNTSFGRKSVE